MRFELFLQGKVMAGIERCIARVDTSNHDPFKVLPFILFYSKKVPHSEQNLDDDLDFVPQELHVSFS